MKAKSRRRLLISSVAMLLVAMLALGTATFAWFTTDSKIGTEGISVKTVKASELRLSNVDTDWTDSTLDYDFTDVSLLPASSGDGTHWWKATADSKSEFTAKSGTVANAGTYSKTNHGIHNYVFMDQLNVANFGGAAIDDVTISFTLDENTVTSGENYLRLALVETSARASTTLPANTGTFTTYLFGGTAGDSANAFTTSATDTTLTTCKAVTSSESANPKVVNNATSGYDISINIGTLAASATPGTAAGGAKYFNLYIWFEGQDDDCFDTNAGNSMPEIKFNVSGNTVSQV